MRCTSCLRNIAAGVEAQKMIVEYRQPDGTNKVFGYMMSDGPITAATGQLMKGFHHKCYWVAKKREAKGNAVTGRVVAGAPTGYDIDQLVLTKDDLDALGITPEQARESSTLRLSLRVGLIRQTAELMGKGVGDPQVQEAVNAAEHGGPYQHHHEHRLDTYQLIAHLEYAHGVKDMTLLGSAAGLQSQHAELHAKAALKTIQNNRRDDDEPEPRTTDWREQHTAVLE